MIKRDNLFDIPLSDSSKRAKNFISSKGYPRYCTATTLPDGTTVLNGGRSRRGKPRGPPGSRELQVRETELILCYLFALKHNLKCFC